MVPPETVDAYRNMYQHLLQLKTKPGLSAGSSSQEDGNSVGGDDYDPVAWALWNGWVADASDAAVCAIILFGNTYSGLNESTLYFAIRAKEATNQLLQNSLRR